jgi:hypothetical protein
MSLTVTAPEFGLTVSILLPHEYIYAYIRTHTHNQIARYVPIEEMITTAAGDTQTTPSCCIPTSPSKRCPFVLSFGPVCGDLITVLPGDLNVSNTRILGNATKEFRRDVAGDGEGNTQNLIFEFVARDLYGNVLTRSNAELVNGRHVCFQRKIKYWYKSNTWCLCLLQINRELGFQHINS